MLSPEALRSALQTTNPNLYRAAYGPNPFTQYQQPTSNWADWADQQGAMSGAYQANPMAALFHAPGYIDPRIMNQSLNLNAANAQNSLQAGITAMGRSAMLGGMADAFQMATRGLETRNRMGIMQNYDIDRANRTRSDITQGQNLLNQAYSRIGGTQGQAASLFGQQQAGPNAFQQISSFGSSALGAYGAFQNQRSATGGLSGTPTGPGYRSYQPGMTPNPYVPSITQQMQTPSPMPTPAYQGPTPNYGPGF